MTMKPKDLLFNGQSDIVLFNAVPSIADDRVVTPATPYGEDDVDDSPWLVDVKGGMITEPIVYDDNNEPITPTMGAPLSFSFDCVADVCKDFLTKPNPDTQGQFICSITIGKKDYIYRPSNLKYPNKKRAKRVWNKWRNRYGMRAEPKIFIPKAKVIPTLDGAKIECLTPNQ